MFDKEKFVQNFKENRAVYVTAISILLAMIFIVAAVVVTNRDKQTLPDTTTPTPSTTTTTTTKKPTINDDPTSDVGSKLPSFSLPVLGKLSGVHDSELQVFSPTMNDYRVHLGIDILANEDTPVYAVAARLFRFGKTLEWVSASRLSITEMRFPSIKTCRLTSPQASLRAQR